MRQSLPGEMPYDVLKGGAQMHIVEKFRTSWLSMPIDRKVRLFGGLFPAAVALIAAVYLFSVDAGYSDIGESFSDISRSLTAAEAVREEKAALETYMRSPSGSSRQALDSAVVHTRSCISLLPDDYERLGEERFARTRNIRNAYAVYAEDREAVRTYNPEAEGAVRELYRVYEEADYLENYLQNLTELTMEQGSAMYENRSDAVRSMPYLMLILAVGIAIAMGQMWNWFSGFIVVPVQKLVKAVRRIGQGDFSGEDVKVENRDELGELTDAVNGMKHAMESNINTLRENQKLSERLYAEENTRLQTEKALESARLDLLQARINPHFLFNTLNVISGMAELEEAETTEKMIRSLSSIFRYNLHTTSQMVTLAQELQVIRDYMYLQKMRFGNRLVYKEETEHVNTDAVLIPAFLLQPLAENAVVHGVAKKEEGGSVTLRVQQEEGSIAITVSDTGVGMSRDSLEQLRRSLEIGPSAGKDAGASGRNVSGAEGHTGVGLRNVYERVCRIYPEGGMTVSAEEGKGMTVCLTLPQENDGKGQGTENVSGADCG